MIRDIEKKEWHIFLQSFGLRHKEWLVTVREDTTTLLENLPLQELNLQDRRLCIRAGEFTTYVKNPVSMKLLETEKGADQALEVTTDQGLTVISIDKPASPERVNGFP